MTTPDDLRTRITEIIGAELDRQHNADSFDAPCVYSRYGNLWGLDGEFNIQAVADAVIAELDLEEEHDWAVRGRTDD